MTANNTATKVQHDMTAATRAATAATAAAGQAVTSATVKAAQTTIDATIEATKSVTAATTKAATAANTRAVADGSFGPAVDDAKKETQQVLDTLAAQTKQISLAWLDAYDSSFDAFLELGKTVAGATQIEVLTNLAEFNTQTLTEINSTFTKAARELLK